MSQIGHCHLGHCHHRLVAMVTLMGAMAALGSSDWRSDDEKAMSCSPAAGQTCTARVYHNMLGAKENCKHLALKKSCDGDAACEANPLQYGVLSSSQLDGHSAVGIPIALNFSLGIPANEATLSKTPAGPGLPMQPVAAQPCGLTILQNLSVASYTRTTTLQPACCVGSGCTTDNYCHPDHNNGHLCTAFHCTVTKWTKCTVEPGGKLEYRYESHVTDSVVTNSQYTKPAYHWFLQPSDMTCKSFKECYCNTNLPDAINNQNAACVANGAKAMCSSS